MAVLEVWRFKVKKAVLDIVGAISKPPINHHYHQMYFKTADKAPLNRIITNCHNLLNCNDIT
jgi:hypothetical protein